MDKTNQLHLAGRSKISFEDLKMKQSVRTTFKLPKDTISLLGLIAGQLGINQKSLLDQLSEDSALMLELAKNAKDIQTTDKKRMTKTFVLSRSSLKAINDAAKKNNIPRDVLVEVSIQRLYPLIKNEREKHLKRKNILAELKQILKHSKNIRDLVKRELGKNDDLYEMVDNHLQLTEKNVIAADKLVNKGRAMEKW